MNCLTKCEAPKVMRDCSACPYRMGYTLCRLLDNMNTLDCEHYNTVHTAQIHSITPNARVTGVFASAQDSCGELVMPDKGEVKRHNILTGAELEKYIDSYAEVNPYLDVDLYKQKLFDLAHGTKFPTPFRIGQPVYFISKEVDLNKFYTLQGKITAVGSSTHATEGKGKKKYQDKCHFHMFVDGKHYYTRANQLGDVYALSDGAAIDGIVLKHPVIGVTEDGYIKPLEITYKNETIIIDNSFIYLKEPMSSIGIWQHNKAVLVSPLDQLVSKKLAQFTNKAFEVVSVYKDSMAPYWLSESLTVEIKR